MKVIFLDWDGVGNDHTQHKNGYCGSCPTAVENINHLLQAEPGARIVFSSAWRYLVHNKSMTLKGLESLFLTHGLNCFNRIEGITGADEEFEADFPNFRTEKTIGCSVRAAQIAWWLANRPDVTHYVVLDDLPIPIKNLVQTDGATGMSWSDVGAAWNHLRRESP